MKPPPVIELSIYLGSEFHSLRVVENKELVIAEVSGCPKHPDHLHHLARLLEQVRAIYFPDSTIAIQFPPSAPAIPAGGDPEPKKGNAP